jgi:MFS transporter, FSR family, fosmidomycin resistance protein
LYFPRQRRFWAVALGHSVNDMFMSMGPVVLAFISVSILPMTNTQIGLTVSASQMMGAVSQPGFGFWADRTGGRLLGSGGLIWNVGFFMLALVGAQTGYFGLLFIPFIVRAIGSGAFHPVGSMYAANSDPSRSATNMSYFFLMGQTGLALGPLLAGRLLDMANPDSQSMFTNTFGTIFENSVHLGGTITPLYALSIMVIPTALFMFFTLPGSVNYNGEMARSGKKEETTNSVALPIKAFVILGAMVTLRSLAQPGSVTFIPVLFQNKGWSPTAYGAVVSSFWIASGISGVLLGNLADNFDRRIIVAVSLSLSAPAFFLLPAMEGEWAFVMAVIAGGLSGGSHSIIVVLAQELIPAAKGFASGAILGFIFATGALGSLLMGAVSDIIGLPATFQLSAGVIIMSGILALALPSRDAQNTSK